MLAIHNSTRYNRRRFLGVGSLALGGFSLSSLLAARAAETPNAPTLATGKSVIFLFQQGGPSQFETFDPKPEAPSDIRTVTGTVQTSIPGVLFGDTLPQLEMLANRLSIIRSFQNRNDDNYIRQLVCPAK